MGGGGGTPSIVHKCVLHKRLECQTPMDLQRLQVLDCGLKLRVGSLQSLKHADTCSIV